MSVSGYVDTNNVSGGVISISGMYGINPTFRQSSTGGFFSNPSVNVSSTTKSYNWTLPAVTFALLDPILASTGATLQIQYATPGVNNGSSALYQCIDLLIYVPESSTSAGGVIWSPGTALSILMAVLYAVFLM